MKQQKGQRILILGGGMAGLQAALGLARRLDRSAHHQIFLISKEPYHYIHRELYGIPAGEATQRTVCLSVQDLIGDQPIEFIHDRVVALKPTTRQVELESTGLLGYDYLVVALGARPTDFGIEGLADHAYQFNTLDDALHLRQALRQLVRRRGQSFKIVVGGGGITGTELTARLASVYKKPTFQFQIVEQSPHLLAGFSSRFSQLAEQELKGLGVDLLFERTIKSVTPSQLKLANGKPIDFDLFIWAGGVQGNPILKQSGLAVDKAGRAIVNSVLQARGFSRIYVVGDSASFSAGRDRPLPVAAPYAVTQGMQVAESIARQLHGQLPIPYEPHGFPTFVTLGHDTALGLFGPIVLKGKLMRFGHLTAEFVYLHQLLPFSQAWNIAYSN